MARRPIDVYRGIIEARLDSNLGLHIDSFVSKFDDYVFAGHPLSAHLTRFLSIVSRLVAYLDSRTVAGVADLTLAIDCLDYFSSTSRWWNIERKFPGFTIRAPTHDPREFMASLVGVTVGANTMSRISGSIDRLSRFLDEHNITSQEARDSLSEALASIWVLLSAFSSKVQGRNTTAEEDFEVAYDVVRILLFHIELDEFKTLSAVRQLGTNPRLARISAVTFSPGFESRLESSLAARLEQTHFEGEEKALRGIASSYRNVFTNSLRLLAQFEALAMNTDRLEDDQYERVIRGTLSRLQSAGVMAEVLHDEASAIMLFKKIRPNEGMHQYLTLLARRLEGLIVATTGNREFLLEYSRLVPRVLSLILLIAGGTQDSSRDQVDYDDIKRSLRKAVSLIVT